MANVKQAIDFVLRQEDSTLSGKITNIPGDQGGTTRFGLTAKWHPELVAQGFFDAYTPAIRALPMAESAYETQYAAKLYLADIQSQAIATALLSFAVLEGPQRPVQLLQAALDTCGASIAPDGCMGQQTLNAVNDAPQDALLDAWLKQEEAYFASLVQHDPSQQKFLLGWDNRAEALKGIA